MKNNGANNFTINNNKATNNQSTPNHDYRLDAEVVVSLKHLNNFWRSFDLPLISNLSCSKYCAISQISRPSTAVLNTVPIEYEVVATTNSTTFQINNAKIYVTVVTLPINDNISFLENIKQIFKRTLSWNK